MKNLIRFLCSRLFLAALCIVLELVQLIALFTLLYEYSLPVSILGWALQFVVLIYVINRDDIPEFKLPWLVLLFLVPVVGAFIFLLISQNTPGRQERGRHKKAMDALVPYAAQPDAAEALRRQNESAYRQVCYLHTAAGVPCYAGTGIDYYPCGEAFFPALCDALESAERFIFLEFFIIQEGRMWDTVHEILKRKAAAGVSVFVMYDDVGCMTTLSGRYYELLRAEGIRAMPANRLRPVFSRRYNNRDHRKIVVVDGRVGFTGGLNLADRYINEEVVYGRWKDSAVRLAGPAVKNLTALFLSAWNTQSDEYIDCAPYMDAPVPPQEDAAGFAVPFGDGPAPLYPDYIGRTVILNIIHAAVRYIYITTPYLVCDREILNALRTAAKKGVDVRLITPHIPDKKTVFLMTRSNYLPLVADGVRIYEYTPGFIHAKNLVADDAYAVCGSINLDYRSLVHNYECGLWTYGAECAAAMRDDFLKTAAISEEITPETAALHGFTRLLAELMKILSTLM